MRNWVELGETGRGGGAAVGSVPFSPPAPARLAGQWCQLGQDTRKRAQAVPGEAQVGCWDGSSVETAVQA